MPLALCLLVVFLTLMLVDKRRTERKMFILLQQIAEQVGIDSLMRVEDQDYTALTAHVNSIGHWNGLKVRLRMSSTGEGIGTELQLNSPSSYRLKIRRSRRFFNFDLVELFTKLSPKVKFMTTDNEEFEVLAYNSSIFLPLLNRSGITQRLQRCIDSQNDRVEIDEHRILIKASSHKFFQKIAWKEIEDKFIQMWFLATSIAALLPLNTKTNINLLKCPYCRGMLNEGAKIVRCNSCLTMFHESCWTENGECAIFSCNSSTSQDVEVKSISQ
jgi:LSD1 subclass zinc finger protein